MRLTPALVSAVYGVVMRYFSATFSLGAWVTGLTLFAFAWIGRSIVTGEASTAAAQ